MRQNSNNKKNHKAPKPDKRRVLAATLAIVLAAVFALSLFAGLVGSTSAVTQSEIDALVTDQKSSQQRQQELKNQLAAIQDDQTQAQQKKAILVEQLAEIDKELTNIQSQISLLDTQIAEKEEERLAAVAREEEQYETFCKRVRAMEEEGDTSYWAVLFKAEDFSDLLDRLTTINDVIDYDNAVMDELIETRQEIERLKGELEDSRTQQETRRTEEQAKRDEQSAKVKEAQAVLDQINANEKEVNDLLDAENAALAKINSDIKKKQQQMEAERQKNNVTFETGSGYAWPLPGYYRLTSAFGGRVHPITGKYHSHTGIDIPAPAGTAILAAKGGQVITSGYDSSYGNYVVVDHGGGNSTLYAHMSKRSVSEGQIVTQGQQLGAVGSTGSSTGNHLHLEVRVNYTRINPESVYPSLPFVRAY